MGGQGVLGMVSQEDVQRSLKHENATYMQKQSKKSIHTTHNVCTVLETSDTIGGEVVRVAHVERGRQHALRGQLGRRDLRTPQ